MAIVKEKTSRASSLFVGSMAGIVMFLLGTAFIKWSAGILLGLIALIFGSWLWYDLGNEETGLKSKNLKV